ncbi:N-formylglutamate amidohydrolase [Sphingomonas sp.]|uniref:N-formylglutamate amidohydrolase n=1 Tax=Sphingomonas sp. TaxID=28214 RepID=UPI003B010007
MAAASPPDPPFVRLGPAGAPTPLVIAVPHAGRCYPDELLAASRLPRSALETIEDRFADLLVADAVRDGAVAIVARVARAYVDLNRDPREIDPAIVRDAGALDTRSSDKVAGGLGAVPSRIAAGGAVWRRPLAAAEIARRLALVHRPYHDAVADALDAAAARHGVALLIDCHSMPSLGPGGARIVLGDLHGRSAALRFTVAALAAVKMCGQPCARNRPYAGGHSLERHGDPHRHRHALQVEVDRALYLDPGCRDPGADLASARTLVATIAAALVAEAGALAQAAE